MCLARVHNAVAPVMLEPAVPGSRVKHLSLSHYDPSYTFIPVYSLIKSARSETVKLFEAIFK